MQVPISPDDSKLPPQLPANQPAKAPPQDPRIPPIRNALKSHEAEEITSKRPAIRARSLSLNEVDRPEHRLTPAEIEQDIKSRNAGGIWECVDRRPAKQGGYIYVFQVNPEFDDLTPKNFEERIKRNEKAIARGMLLYPAIEPGPLQIGHLQPFASAEEEKEYVENTVAFRWRGMVETNPILENSYSKNIILTNLHNEIQQDVQMGQFLRPLGYRQFVKDGKVFVEVPDKVALQANWELFLKQREKDHPTKAPLPSLDINSSEGIAGDLEFVRSYIRHHALLSDGAEFFHDHFFHIIPAITLLLIVGDTEYTRMKNQAIRGALTGYRRIELGRRELEEGKILKIPAQRKMLQDHLDQMEAYLGAFVDTIASVSNPALFSETSHSIGPKFYDIANLGPHWTDYMEKRFQSKKVTQEIGDAWGLLGCLDNVFRAAKKGENEQGQAMDALEGHAITLCRDLLMNAQSDAEVRDVVDQLEMLRWNKDDLLWVLVNAKFETVSGDVVRTQSVLFRPHVLEFLLKKAREFPKEERVEIIEIVLKNLKPEDSLISALQVSDTFKTLLPLLVTFDPKDLKELLEKIEHDGMMVYQGNTPIKIKLGCEEFSALFNAYAQNHPKDKVVEFLDTQRDYRDFGNQRGKEKMIDMLVRIKTGQNAAAEKWESNPFRGDVVFEKELLPPLNEPLRQILEKHFPEQLRALTT